MVAKIKTTVADQSGVFYFMLGLMMIFWLAHMIFSFLHIVHYTEQLVGGDLNLQTFREILIVAMMIFRSEGKSIADKILGETVKE